MGRVRQMIKVDGRDSWALFDTGARNTYITRTAAESLPKLKAPHPFRSGLGGRVIETDLSTVLQGEVQGRLIATHALVVDSIGTDEDGKPIDVLFGALAMEQWGIRPVPDEDRLDLSNYPEEFVEY